MTYLSDRRRRKKKTIYLLGIAFLLLIIVGCWKYVATGIRFLVTPVITSYSSFSSSVASLTQTISNYTDVKASAEKIHSLELAIEKLENDLALKNAQLEERSVALTIQDEDSISRSVIVLYPHMRDITQLYSTILLSKGFKDGVEVGDQVFIRGRQPVCTIKEVYTTTSLCELLSASGRSLTGVLRHSSSTMSIMLTGRGGGVFLGDIPRDVLVENGDVVYAEGDPSMILGYVTESIHNDQDTSWRVFVRGMYNPLTSHVFYIKK